MRDSQRQKLYDAEILALQVKPAPYSERSWKNRQARHFNHIKVRLQERYNQVQVSGNQLREIRHDIESGLLFCYGKFFEKNRKFDSWYRAFLNAAEVIVIFNEGVIKTVFPIEAKTRVTRALKEEYGLEKALRILI